jgi:hypothetical protein
VRRHPEVILAAALWFLPATPLAAQDFPLVGIDRDSETTAVFEKLQAAVRNDDSLAVEALVVYPLTVIGAGYRYRIYGSDSFLAHYRDIITPNVRKAILGQLSDNFWETADGIIIGSGQAHLQRYCSPLYADHCSPLGLTVVEVDAPETL